MLKTIRDHLRNPLYFRVMFVALGLLGQFIAFQRTAFRADRHVVYYTNLSNILAIIVALYLLIKHSRIGKGQPLIAPTWVGKLRFAASAGISLTFVGFSLLLIPMTPASYLLSVDNLLVHNLVPILSVLDYLMFDEGVEEGQPRLRWGLLLGFFYLLLTLTLFQSGFRYARGAAGPYFFLDPDINGWFTLQQGKLGVVWWMFIILFVQLALSHLIQRWRKNLVLKKMTKR